MENKQNNLSKYTFNTFSEFLHSQNLGNKLENFIFYAIALIDNSITKSIF